MRSDSPTQALKEHMRYCRVPNRKEECRFAIAQRYGVPVSWVMLEHELTNWRTTRGTVKPSVGFLSNLRSHAQSSLKACSQVLAILLSWAGKS